jgi:nucleoside-diphosphate-sugar epimerase
VGAVLNCRETGVWATPGLGDSGEPVESVPDKSNQNDPLWRTELVLFDSWPPEHDEVQVLGSRMGTSRPPGGYRRVANMRLPGLVITGSSGFLGRHLLERLEDEYKIFGIARRSPAETGAPIHRNISWFQVDIADRDALATAFRHIREQGGARYLIHLAAHYDFTGEDDPHYQRTNVEGMRYVLEECRELRLERFVFASSVAASDFLSTEDPTRVVDETTVADAPHPYGRSKRQGEEMLAEYKDEIPYSIIRYAALFSDWCEYPPLFIFLKTWLSNSWRRKIIGGRGEFAIPFLHVREAARVTVTVMRKAGLGNGEVILASPNGAVTTRQLFEKATLHYFGSPSPTINLPKSVCGAGMYARDRILRLLGHRPFERPWMSRYIDRQLRVDATRSQELIDWRPRGRLTILRRLPFMIENFKTDPLEWNRRNHAAMRIIRPTANLKVHRLLEKHEARICDTVSTYMASREGRRVFPNYRRFGSEEREWNHRVALRHLMDSVRTRDKSIYGSFCRDLAELRYAQGFEAEEVCEALRTLRDVCMRVLSRDPGAADLDHEIENSITMTMLFGCDQVENTFEELADRAGERLAERPESDLAGATEGPPTWLEAGQTIDD